MSILRNCIIKMKVSFEPMQDSLLYVNNRNCTSHYLFVYFIY